MKIIQLDKKKKKDFRGMFRRLVNLLITVTLALFVLQYFACYMRLEGHSMEPAMEPGSIILVDRIRYCALDPERFDIIAYRDKTDEGLQIKRVVGLPGEEVEIRDGKILINGRKLTEADTFIGQIEITGRASKPVQLGSDEYFVIGDNPARSQDSRFENTGNVERNRIFGRVWFSMGSLFSAHFWF